jgi:hypothetical protein
MLAKIYLIALCFVLIPLLLMAQEGELIINPKLEGGLGAFPIWGSRYVKTDTIVGPFPKTSTTHRKDFKELYPDGVKAVSLLITGKVPNPSKRWVVAMTKDEDEFKRVFPEYKALIADGKKREACQVLHFARGLAVGTSVKRYNSKGEKTGNLPSKVGNFFFDLDIMAIKNHGGYLTFLSYDPKPGDDIVDYGYGIEDTVHGVLLVEKYEDGDKDKIDYRMKVLKAEITSSYRPGEFTRVVKQND